MFKYLGSLFFCNTPALRLWANRLDSGLLHFKEHFALLALVSIKAFRRIYFEYLRKKFSRCQPHWFKHLILKDSISRNQQARD